MKLLGIHGGPHKNGNSITLLKEALEGAQDFGAEVELISLIDYEIDYCHGCMKCMNLGKCVLKDDFLSIKEKMLVADGIIFSSPTYGMKPTARMKNFITDRLGMLSVYTSEFGGKYFAGIASAGAFGAKVVAKDMATSFQVGFFKNGFTTGYLGVEISKNYKMLSVDRLPQELQKARQLGINMVNAIRSKKTYPLQKIGSKIITKLIIRRYIIKNILKNKDDKLKAVYEQIVSENYIIST